VIWFSRAVTLGLSIWMLLAAPTAILLGDYVRATSVTVAGLTGLGLVRASRGRT